MNQYSAHELFKIGENIAATHLISCGYTVICRNYLKPCGEIDLIVEKDQHLIFCEVKTRTSHSINSALASVSYTKQKKLTRTALEYINQFPGFANHQFRFDVLIVFYYPHNESFSVRHFEDAFLPILDT